MYACLAGARTREHTRTRVCTWQGPALGMYLCLCLQGPALQGTYFVTGTSLGVISLVADTHAQRRLLSNVEPSVLLKMVADLSSFRHQNSSAI